MEVLVRHKGGRLCVALPASPVLGDLNAAIEKLTGIPKNRQRLRVGFPPSLIAQNSPSNYLLSSLGVQANDCLILEEGSDSNGESTQVSPVMGSASINAASCRNKEGNDIKGAVLNQRNIPVDSEAFTSSSPLTSVSKQQGGGSGCVSGISQPSDGPGHWWGKDETVPADRVRTLSRLVVDADNSCLFMCIHLLATPNVPVQELRERVANVIKRSPERFSDAILDQPRDEYIQWIQNPSSWGGYVELTILAEEFNVEIAAVDVQSGRVDYYGFPEYGRRIYLVYDGVHYDAVVSLPPGYDQSYSSNSGWAQNQKMPCGNSDSLHGYVSIDKGISKLSSDFGCMFDPIDGKTLQKAKDLVRTLRTQQAFVPGKGMLTKCLICGEFLENDQAVKNHAISTGHSNFGHVGH